MDRSKVLQHARTAALGVLFCLLATSYFMGNAVTTREIVRKNLMHSGIMRTTVAAAEATPTPSPAAHAAATTSSVESKAKDASSLAAFFDDVRPMPKRRVAVTVLFGTGNRRTDNTSTGGLMDGACVLRQTMLEFKPHDVTLEFIGLIRSEADVHPLVLTTLKAHCGFSFRVSATTVDPSAIADETLRHAISKDTVGALELLKLHNLLMTEYELVLCLDADIMFVGPYDDLLVPFADIPYRQTPDCNGGIVVYFPRNNGAAHVEAILKAFVSTPYSPKTGYANYTYGAVLNANMGLSGGPLLQGLLPFYMAAHLQRNPRHPDLAIKKCRHNYFVAMSHFKVCEDMQHEDIRSVHFKGGDGTFPKPWDCPRLKDGCLRPNCQHFHRRFLEEHQRLLRKLPPRPIVLDTNQTSATTATTGAAAAGVAHGHLSGCYDGVFFGMEYQLTGRLLVPRPGGGDGGAVDDDDGGGGSSTAGDIHSSKGVGDAAGAAPSHSRHGDADAIDVPPDQRRRIAVTVLFGSGNQVSSEERSADKLKNTTVGLINGACILRQTMLRYKPENVDLEFIGLVKSMDDVSSFLISTLRKHCGFSFRLSNTTVNPEAIVNKALKKEVRKDTVGVLELLKLHSLLMTEYELVLCLDADIMFVGPYDDLLVPFADIPYRQTPDCNGGIVVYFPRNNGAAHVEAILQLFLSSPYSRQRGYERTYYGAILDARRGLSGGPMLQGLLPFYIHTQLQRNPREASMAIQPCRHNYYVAPEAFGICENIALSGIRSVHFKGGDGFFSKPWDCARVALCTRPNCLHFQHVFAQEHLALMESMPGYRANRTKVGCDKGNVFHGIEQIAGGRGRRRPGKLGPTAEQLRTAATAVVSTPSTTTAAPSSSQSQTSTDAQGSAHRATTNAVTSTTAGEWSTETPPRTTEDVVHVSSLATRTTERGSTTELPSEVPLPSGAAQEAPPQTAPQQSRA